MPSVGHMPTCYRFWGAFPGKGVWEPGSKISCLVEDGRLECGYVSCSAVVFHSRNSEVVSGSPELWEGCSWGRSSAESSVCLSALIGPCQWLHTATGSPPFLNPGLGELVTPSLYPFISAWGCLDGPHTDRLRSQQMQAAAFPESCEFWERSRAPSAVVLGLCHSKSRPLGLQPGPFHSFHLCFHFEMHQSP